MDSAARLALHLVVLVVSLLHHSSEAAVRVITENPPQFAAADPLAPKYVVALFEAGLKVPGLDLALPSRPLSMTDQGGQRYSCHVPLHPPPDSTPTSNSNKQQVAAPGSSSTAVSPPPPPASEATAVEEPKPQKTPFEMLELLAATPCLYTHDGQWTYEMCYKRHVRQFRQENSGKSEDFLCGEYLGDEEQDEAVLEGPSASGQTVKYVSHRFGRGSKCLLTGGPRTAEVRFTCKRGLTENQLLSAREFPTCNYLVLVASPFLCDHPDFKPPVEDQRLIACYPEGGEPKEGESAAAAAAAAAAAGAVDAGTKGVAAALPAAAAAEDRRAKQPAAAAAEDREAEQPAAAGSDKPSQAAAGASSAAPADPASASVVSSAHSTGGSGKQEGGVEEGESSGRAKQAASSSSSSSRSSEGGRRGGEGSGDGKGASDDGSKGGAADGKARSEGEQVEL